MKVFKFVANKDCTVNGTKLKEGEEIGVFTNKSSVNIKEEGSMESSRSFKMRKSNLFFHTTYIKSIAEKIIRIKNNSEL